MTVDELMGDTLERLLDAELDFDPTTRSGLSSHLPMALLALDRLAAPDDRLVVFFDDYATGLVPLRPEAGIELDGTTWTEVLGRRSAAGDLRRYFEHVVAATDVDTALREYLPALVPGIGSAAFHGVIRLAYAVESNNPRQVAAGLAYLASVYLRLADAELTDGENDDPVALLADLRDHPQLGRRTFGAGNITVQMARVARTPEFQDIGGVAIDARSLERIAFASVRLHASTNDFTALHAVTGTHATRVLLPYLDAADRARALRFLFQAIAAAYLTIGSPPIETEADLARGPAPAWDSIVAAATASDDEHVIKLAYSARAERDQWGHDPLYRRSAAREARLVA